VARRGDAGHEKGKEKTLGEEVRKIDRRQFLKAGGAAFLITASVAGCDALSTDPAQRGGNGGQNGSAGQKAKGKEAPMLADRVKNGDLPPVEERLPSEPLVVEPTDRMGQYGGEWNSALLGAADTAWLVRTIGYENLTRWQPEVRAFSIDEVIPNIAESFESSDDGTEFTFKLRKGMKWSDGEPFSADDLVFAQNDVFLNKELFPDPPFEATAEKVDDNTVRFTFKEPESLFVHRQATPSGELLVTLPRHYLEQFHKEFNPDVGQLVKKEDAADWVELFTLKSDIFQNTELPTLNPWVITTPLGEGSRVVAERNPYFWKTDPDGSQLPYIDRVVFDVVSDPEIMITKTLGGEMDMHVRHFNVPSNKPVIAENRDRGAYDFFDTLPSSMNTFMLALNLAHKDQTKRQIYQNKDFRIGLSHAINRQEIIDVVYQSQGEPWQGAPRPQSPFHNQELAKQYTEYDVDLANRSLDQAGYKNSNGQRLGPDGKPIVVTVEFATALVPEWPDVLELIQRYWREVGIKLNIRQEDRTLFYERKEANEHDAAVWLGDGGLDVVLEPRWYFPFSTESNFAIPWATWFGSGGETGPEPPEAAKQQMELYNQINRTVDSDERAELMTRILQIAQEQFWVMGMNLTPPGYGIVKNNFHNVRQQMVDAYLYPTPGPTNPEQYFISGD
jgi:ABC-type transport system substrate-binding protein